MFCVLTYPSEIMLYFPSGINCAVNKYLLVRMSYIHYSEQTHLLLQKMIVLEQKLKSMEMQLKNVSVTQVYVKFIINIGTLCRNKFKD